MVAIGITVSGNWDDQFQREFSLLDMETLILVFALVTSAAGTLILLACLAGRRAELVKAFNVQQQSGTDREPASETPAEGSGVKA